MSAPRQFQGQPASPQGRVVEIDGGKRLFGGHRQHVRRFTPEQRKRICWLFDSSGGDADYTAERCGIVKVQRGDVLAVVLAETRKGRLAA